MEKDAEVRRKALKMKREEYVNSLVFLPPACNMIKTDNDAFRERKLRTKVEREEEKLKELAAEKQRQREEDQRRKEEMVLEEMRLTGGIQFQLSLQPIAVDGEDDRITVSETAMLLAPQC